MPLLTKKVQWSIEYGSFKLLEDSFSNLPTINNYHDFSYLVLLNLRSIKVAKYSRVSRSLGILSVFKVKL